MLKRGMFLTEYKEMFVNTIIIRSSVRFSLLFENEIINIINNRNILKGVLKTDESPAIDVQVKSSMVL
jgi:hypothetical protein